MAGFQGPLILTSLADITNHVLQEFQSAHTDVGVSNIEQSSVGVRQYGSQRPFGVRLEQVLGRISNHYPDMEAFVLLLVPAVRCLCVQFATRAWQHVVETLRLARILVFRNVGDVQTFILSSLQKAFGVLACSTKYFVDVGRLPEAGLEIESSFALLVP